MPAVLIDLDGVIYQNNNLIHGAVNTINWLREEKIPFLFLTNTTSIPRETLFKKLLKFRINVTQDMILTPPVAATHWIAKHAPGPTALFVSDDTRQDFQGHSIWDHSKGIVPESVVIGEMEWTSPELNNAFRLLMADPKPVLLALGMSRYWRGSDGLKLDVGPFVKALEFAADCQSIVLGKPAGIFFETALQILESQPSEAIMIGDDLVSDIQGAQQAGIRGLLVRTGKFRQSDLESGIQPAAVLESIADLPKWWRQKE